MYQPNFQSQFKQQFNTQRPQQALFPAYFSRLQVVCSSHGSPVPMEFIGYSWSDKLPNPAGPVQRVALYRCPVDGTVEAYAQHRLTGEPFLLRTVSGAQMRHTQSAPRGQQGQQRHYPAPRAATPQRPTRHSFY